MRYYILICIFLQMRCTSKPYVAAILYEGAQVWRTKFDNPNDVLILKKLMDNNESPNNLTGVSIWSLLPKTADYLVKSEDKLHVHRLLSGKKINHTVMIMDVGRRVDSLKVDNILWSEKSLRIGHRLNWNEYPTMTVIDEYYNYISENFPSICTLRSIGQTAENRTITMISISNGNPENKAILITSGLHAREWAAITSTLYVANHIITKFDTLPEHIRNCDWKIIPLVNPDGFEYSHKYDRLWRKNRRSLGKCVGVDINRNFGQDWHIEEFTDTNECCDRFGGKNSFSEPEAIALRNLINNSTKKPTAVVDIHMYGQMILYPRTASANVTKDRKLHEDVAGGMSKAIHNKTGETYKLGTGYQMMYPATGSLIDWFNSAGVNLTFAIETQDKGNFGYLLPRENIEGAGKDVLAAVSYLAERVFNETRKEKVVKNETLWF